MPDPPTGDPKGELRRIRTVAGKLKRIGIEIGASYVRDDPVSSERSGPQLRR